MIEHGDACAHVEFALPVRIYYEDTDAAGVVYHANYLRFMERARTEWLRTLGHDPQDLLQQQSVAFAVCSARLKFLRPARYNALLHVGALLLKLGRASLSIGQEVREMQSGNLICTGEVDLAAVDVHTLRPRALPKCLHEQLAERI